MVCVAFVVWRYIFGPGVRIFLLCGGNAAYAARREAGSVKREIANVAFGVALPIGRSRRRRPPRSVGITAKT